MTETPNSKQMIGRGIQQQIRFGHCDFEFGIYLLFGACELGFFY